MVWPLPTPVSPGPPFCAPRAPPAAAGDESDAALRRTCYSDVREWEAETLASMILTWAQSAGNSVGVTADNKEVRGLQRLLGGHKGWL